MSTIADILALPGLQIDIQREMSYAYKIDRAESQFEVRTIWSTTPIYLYNVKVWARSETSSSEISVVTSVFEGAYGGWSSFSLTDPVDGQSRTVRFNGALKMTRFKPGASGSGGWWKCEFQLQSCTNPSI